MGVLRSSGVAVLGFFASLIALYYLIAAPPLHFVFPILESDQKRSVYVPGEQTKGYWQCT